MPQPNDDENEDVLDLNEDQELDEADGNEPEDEDEERSDEDEPNPETNDEADDEETVVSFGESEEEQPGDSSVIRDLRKELRETKRQLREAATAAAAPKKIERRPKPTMADHSFDEEAFEADLDKWKEEERAADAQQEQIEATNRQVNEAWNQDFSAYQAKKAELKFEDVDDATDAVSSTLDLVQQAVIVKSADNPAMFVYAVGKSPAKLAELAKIKDPIKLAAAVARMEGGIKVVTRKKGAAIDTPQRGSKGTPQAGDKDKQIQAKLAKLEKDVENGGNRTELINFKKKHGLI